jgi:hypothetical protein
MDTKQRLRGLGLLALVLLAAGPAFAGQHRALPRAAPPPAARAMQTPANMPNLEQVYVLIRSAILTLDTAVRAGNFSVLRDVGAPSFQAANTSARLARIFQNLDQQRVDLSSVAIAAPTITNLQSMDQGRRLRVTGYFPSPTTRIDFDLIFEQVGARWRIFGISVNPAPAMSRINVIPAPVVARNSPNPAPVQPAPASQTRLPQFSPSWEMVSNARR